MDAENALELTNKKFIARFTRMESMAKEEGNDLSKMGLQEMDDLWNKIKQLNKSA